MPKAWRFRYGMRMGGREKPICPKIGNTQEEDTIRDAEILFPVRILGDILGPEEYPSTPSASDMRPALQRERVEP